MISGATADELMREFGEEVVKLSVPNTGRP